MTSPTAAIVTTLRDAGAMIDSFIAYHLRIGFSRLFLFFDDPNDPDMARLSAVSGIRVIGHDAALREKWQSLPEYSKVREFLDREVMSRQVLNAAVAMDLARGEGIDWLLHIDSDELFFLSAGNVADHFAATAFDTIRYINLEAVPERDVITDPFREVDLFKVSIALDSGPKSAQDQALLESTPQLTPGRRFHFYSNGKSAVRLSSGLRPKGVHGWGDAQGEASGENSQSGLVLHYACCGFEAFWRKYARLGDFPDRWFGAEDIVAAIGPVHLQARDACAKGREAALEFYRTRIAIEDRARAQALVRAGVLVRFPQVTRLLARMG